MHSTRNLAFILGIFLISVAFPSCVNSRKIVYLDNIPDTIINSPGLNKEAIIQKSDILNITVSSLNPAASSIFNSPNLVSPTSAAGVNSATGTGILGGSSSSSPTTNGQQLMGYLVDVDGNIKFPVLGNVKA